VDGSAMGNSPVTMRGIGAGEDLGEKAQQAGPSYQRRWRGNGRRAGSHTGMGRGTVEAGRRGRKRPAKPFPF
jgi:hypothetical protein